MLPAIYKKLTEFLGLSTIDDPDGKKVLRVHEAAPWVVFKTPMGVVVNPLADDNGTVVVNPSLMTTPEIYNVTLTSANIQYTMAFPPNTRYFRVSIRAGLATNTYRLAYVTGKVATSVAPFLTYTQDKQYIMSDIRVNNLTLYLASSTAGAVAEIEVWYK